MRANRRTKVQFVGSLILAVALLLASAGIVLTRGARAEASVVSRTGLEVGAVSVNQDWKRVALQRTFADPVVIAGIPTRNGSRAVVTAVRNVTGSSFEIRLVDWQGRTHKFERVAYLVTEAGTRMVGGKRWTAGHADNVTTKRRTVGLKGFAAPPAVLATIVTSAGADPATARVERAATGFSVRVVERDPTAVHYANERVDYLAIEPGAGTGTLSMLSANAEIAASVAVPFRSAIANPAVFAQLTAETTSAAKALRLERSARTSMMLRAESDGPVAASALTSTPMSYLVIDLNGANVVPTTTTAPPTSTTTQPSTTTTTTPIVVSPCAPPTTGVIRLSATDPIAQTQATIDNAAPGATIVFGPGEFRGLVIRPKANQSFYGSRSQDCRRLSVLNGSELLPRTGWTFNAANSTWSQSGLGRGVIGIQSHGCEPGAPGCDPKNAGCESAFPKCQVATDLFRNNQQLHHVAASTVTGAAWNIDMSTGPNAPNGRTIVIGQDPTASGARLELARNAGAFLPTATGVRVEGLIVEKYASPHQQGAIGGFGGAGWQVIDNEVRMNHGAGFAVGSNGLARNNYSHHNGQIGAKVGGTGARVIGNVLTDNNTSGVRRTWEAGGLKSGRSTGVVVSGNCVANNDGNGIWADVLANQWTIEDNVVAGNQYQGIFYEVSTNGVIRNNTAGGNGAGKGWIMGAQIQLVNSSGTSVSGNVVDVAPGYGNGITVIWATRTDNNGLYRNTTALGNRVFDNDVYYGGPAGVSGMRNGSSNPVVAAYDQVYDPAAGTRFSGNRYHVPAADNGKRFLGAGGQQMTLAQQQAASQETGSTLDNARSTRSLSCASFTTALRS